MYSLRRANVPLGVHVSQVENPWHRALNNPYPIYAADGYYTRDSSCITLLWLHHNHNVCVSYHKTET